jgi:hypothetical protein
MPTGITGLRGRMFMFVKPRTLLPPLKEAKKNSAMGPLRWYVY